MIEGVERLVDLVGFTSSGLTGATQAEVTSAVRACDTRRLAATDGHFACVAREGSTVRMARTIGIPLRYFVAKMYHGPLLVVADRVDRIFEWCRAQRIGWQFDPAYTRMVPAHYLVELDQIGCPDPAPRSHRFFEPAIGAGFGGEVAQSEALTIAQAGAAYINAARVAMRTWIAQVPAGAPIGVAFSGGIDSTAALLLARQALKDLGRDPDLVRSFTLDLGGGRDAAQALAVVQALSLEATWERVAMPAHEYDLEEAIRAIEDYHPLDVECAAAVLALLRGVRARYPELKYFVDGDGGDENLKSYPLADSDLTLSSVLRNPLLYHEGWGIEAIKHSLVYTGGLSRAYVRTCAPATACRFEAFSPFTVRSVIVAALAIPFAQLLAGRDERLATLKGEVVAAGLLSEFGIDLEVHPKRRFQDGVTATPRARVAKAWCRLVFDRQWRERLAVVEGPDQRSGNEMSLPANVAVSH